MSQTVEFIANNPFLVTAAAAMVGIIIVYEVRRATRGFADIEPADATRLVNNEDATMLDVRAAADFEKSRILHAINIPQAELADRTRELEKRAGRPVIVYSSTGGASGRAASQLVGAGIGPVYNLKGGLSTWESAGLPVMRGRQGGKK